MPDMLRRAQRWNPALARSGGLWLPGKKLFVPTDIAGCVLWLDASNAGSITSSGGAVSQWSDLSGAGNHATQGTAAQKPTTGTRTQNGLNVIDFDGLAANGDNLVTALTSSDRTQTTFIVFLGDTRLPPSVNTDDSILLTSTGAGRELQVRRDNSNRLSVNKATVAVLCDYSVATPVNSTAYVYVAALGATDIIQSLNGSAEETDSNSTTFTAALTTQISFSGSGTTKGLDGWMAEIVVYDTQLNLANRDTVRQYLRNKWAVY